MAKTLPNVESIDTTPAITSKVALEAAQDIVVKYLNVSDAKLSKPRLEIFNRGLLDGSEQPTRLAWFIEATNLTLREYIWIDAQLGVLLLHFSQNPEMKTRNIYDTYNTSTLPGDLVRSEGDLPTGDPDADMAYDFTGDAYDYFFVQHGRDSYDGAGATLVSTVDYCEPDDLCPWKNARWTGSQMVYGDGYSAADDVVAHELTHAVTENTGMLFYYMQSGALNESYSDVFGETVDLTNNAGNDSSTVRWLLGEDLPNGAFRDMMNPTSFDHPGKVSDPEFICTTGDYGGVHTNSGVPNHAYALMVDGGMYNGQTMTGIGLLKADKIQYRALTNYLVSSSDFLDNYNALQQSCADLVGTAGITSADCDQVKKALDSVEMAEPVCLQSETPLLCPEGEAAQYLFSDDLENTLSGNWNTSILSDSTNHWTNTNYCTGSPDIYCTLNAKSGSYSLWGFDSSIMGDSVVEMTQDIVIPATGAHMQFNHSFSFETFFDVFDDGGVLEYSTDSGANWFDAGPLISAGETYGGTITGNGNPLDGRQGFVYSSFGYTASQLNLDNIAGHNVRFRFRTGTNNIIFDNLGWFIDDVQIYTCIIPGLRIDDVSKTEGNTGTSPFNFQVTLLPASTGTVTVNYATVNGTALAGSDYTTTSGTLTFLPGETSKMVTVNVTGDTQAESNETFIVNLGGAYGASIADLQGMGTIINDDVPLLRIDDVSKMEGNTGTSPFNFQVTLLPASTGTVTVNYATVNGTALAGSDYTTTSGTLTFLPGETSKMVTVNVTGDTQAESNETFIVNLGGAYGASIADLQGMGTIINDDY